MTILRNILIGLMGFICLIALSTFIYLLTLQTTLMDRTVVKGWLSESQVYDDELISAFIQPVAVEGEQAVTAPQGPVHLSPDILKSSLNATFTPDFVRTHIEGVIDNAYDWVEGKTPTFAFSIPVHEKRDAFIQQLSKAIEPQIAALPVCESVLLPAGTLCRPSAMSIEQLAHQTANQSVTSSRMFGEPITNESFTQNAAELPQPANTSALSQLPAITTAINLLLVALPILALLSAAVAILASPSGRRLVAAIHLSRRLFFSLLLILIPAAFIAWIVKTNTLSLSNLLTVQAGELFVPLIKTVLVGILGKLALFSGIGALISAAIWAGLALWRRQQPNPIVPATLPKK